MIDLHSHILPGIDDGASSLDDSVALVRELESVGVSEVFATPHYVDETIYTSPRSRNLELIDELSRRLLQEGIKTRVHLGNEIYICKDIEGLLKAGTISAMGGSDYVLVELPMSGDFPGYRDILLALIRDGYHVILAHPERYTSFQNDFSLISDLYEMGVLLQCNLGSFAGQYGRGAFKTARKLAKSKMIFGVGSDIHHVHPGLLAEGMRKLAKYYSSEELAEILTGNPGKILGFSNN